MIYYKDVAQVKGIEQEFELVQSEVFPFGSKISITFCDNDYITKINQECLKHNYPTDIITFYYNEAKPETDAELLISLEEVANNAKTYGTSFNNEVRRVIIHGLLHLKGFNDQTEEEKLTMRNEENKYLKKLFHVEPK
jgi:rRNA maturation RNase YbeY